MLIDLKAGIYKHYKGRYHQVLGYAHDANADSLFEQVGSGVDFRRLDTTEDGEDTQRVVVLYIGLELDDSHNGPRMAVRTAEDFFLPICWDADCSRFGSTTPGLATHCSICGNQMWSRFEYVGSSWDGRV